MSIFLAHLYKSTESCFYHPDIGVGQNLKFYVKSFLCDGQSAVRRAILYTDRHQGYKKNFMLNSAESEIFPAHKY